MPRKTSVRSSARPRGQSCFNEAAARCRGKPGAEPLRSPAPGTRASMRPRPDAAENLVGDDAKQAVAEGRFNEAAARCRGKPVGATSFPSHSHAASMRPRPDAAENRPDRRMADPVRRGFNEAAARCRGKPEGAAEEAAGAVQGFNEAAARCRGKPPTPEPIDFDAIELQ